MQLSSDAELSHRFKFASCNSGNRSELLVSISTRCFVASACITKQLFCHCAMERLRQTARVAQRSAAERCGGTANLLRKEWDAQIPNACLEMHSDDIGSFKSSGWSEALQILLSPLSLWRCCTLLIIIWTKASADEIVLERRYLWAKEIKHALASPSGIWPSILLTSLYPAVSAHFFLTLLPR